MEDQSGECCEIEKLSFERIKGLLPITYDYLFSNRIADFYTYHPNWDGIKRALTERTEFDIDRNLLVTELTRQYSKIETSKPVSQNLSSLKEPTTFTFTTGHQLSLFTGPSYFFYKIISVIKLAKEAKKKFPHHQFVPVFWMATEDHDFEEIASTWIQNEKTTWEREANGPVGRLSLENLENAFSQFSKSLGINDRSKSFIKKIQNFFTTSNSYGEFVQQFVNELFGEFGIVVIDADAPSLKRELISVIQDDLFHSVTHKKATETSEALKELGCTDQIHVREVNFFYLLDGFRERIERHGDFFKVVNSSVSFSAEEMLSEIKSHPERFSPNVSLRPVYQELILPNVAYVGGGAEVAYWLQLKGVFKKHNAFFPVILMRDSATVLPQKAKKWIQDIGISTFDLFRDKQLVFKELVQRWSTNSLELVEEKQKVEELFNSIKPKVSNVQPTLSRTVEGEKVKILNRLKSIEKKLIREEKRNHQVQEERLEKLYQLVKPNGTLQERKQNFLPFYIDYRNQLFSALIDSFDATQAEMKIVYLR